MIIHRAAVPFVVFDEVGVVVDEPAKFAELVPRIDLPGERFGQHVPRSVVASDENLQEVPEACRGL